MNVRSGPNKTPNCAFSRFPVTPKGHPSAVDVPLLGYLSSLPPAEKPLSAAGKTLLTTASRLIWNGSWPAKLHISYVLTKALKARKSAATCPGTAGPLISLQHQRPGLKTLEASPRSEACRACLELVYLSKF